MNGDKEYPDPCSHFQPEGPHGSSMIVDPYRYQWHDQEWKGVEMKGQVIYELHIGTFTSEGTFDAAIKELEENEKYFRILVKIVMTGYFLSI